jgi:multiphosphoryl transfer protein
VTGLVGMSTVGLVVVSHSPILAAAAVALAEEMLHGRVVRIEQAAGLEDGTFGTDAVRVAQAITRADAGQGVVVLMDLGSAVLSAGLALELVEPALRERVVLCPAPLVEGLTAAAVAASTGAGRDQVAAEALTALDGKRVHLAPVASAPPDRVPLDAGVSARFEVTWPHGLHARPAAVLVQAVRDLDADVRLRNVTTGSELVRAGSLSAVATLGAARGHVMEVVAAGREAQAALDRVLDLATTGFGDLPPSSSSPSSVDQGIRDDQGVPGIPRHPLPAAPGVAIGPAWLLPAAEPVHVDTADVDPADVDPADVDPADVDPADVDSEWALLREALADVEKDIGCARDSAARTIGEAEAWIFDAHLLLLEDPELLGRVGTAIEGGRSARAAWASAVDGVEESFTGLPDAELRARAADVRAVGDQVLRRLGGSSVPPPALDEARGVLVAPDLTPAQAATLDPARVSAVVLAGGSPAAHAAILTRALGIPMVVAAGPAVLSVAPGTPMAVDGGSGEVVVDPAADVRAAFEQRARALVDRRVHARELADAPAVTLDGLNVHVGANVSSVEDARAATAAGADLAGLVRSEFLFLGRSRPPDVDEQAAVYRAIAEAMPNRRIVIRTLDVGGDKPLDYLPVPAEANPFLGIRGIRLALARPDLLTDQLQAIVRVAREYPIDVMFPMVTTVGELLAARRALADSVRTEGGGTPVGLRVGIMVEVPATALKARAFAPHVDFLSVGTNDLTQYALAAERGNEAVAALADPLDPGVLGLVAAAARADVPVAVCGELAADDTATGLLLGLGVRELSVVPPAVGQVKQAVREVDLGKAAELAQRALVAPDAAAVRALLS